MKAVTKITFLDDNNEKFFGEMHKLDICIYT